MRKYEEYKRPFADRLIETTSMFSTGLRLTWTRYWTD
jgi:hypothetical protein